MTITEKLGSGALAVAFLAGAVPAGADEEKPKPPVIQVSASSSEGFAIKSESGDFKLQLKGLVQFDARVFASDQDNALIDTFLVRRARPIFQGTVARYFDFNFTPDFGVGTAIIQDFFLDAKASRAFAVKVGKFKPPIGVEHLQSDAYLPFPERSFPASLEPNRDVGAVIHGDLAKGVLSYTGGVFDGTPDGASVDTDTNDGKSLLARVVVSPFKAGKSVLAGLGLGIAASREKQSGASASAAGYKSGGQNPFFSYATGVAPAGTRTRVAPELSFFSGPVGILAEYVKSEARLTKTTTTAATATAPARTTVSGPFSFANDAWHVTASVFLTGDGSAFEGVTIRKPFDPAKRQWGGLQLAARFNQFTADDLSFTQAFADLARSARKARAWAIGLNWYLNKNVKQALSFERTSYTGGAAQGADRRAENALILRSQLAF